MILERLKERKLLSLSIVAYSVLFIIVILCLRDTANEYKRHVHSVQQKEILNSPDADTHIQFLPSKNVEPKTEDNCFCDLQGEINEDCSCQIDAVDKFNNYKIFPRLQSLLSKNYFRYVKVNLRADCPFWSDDSTCSFEFCQVKSCEKDDLPRGILAQQQEEEKSDLKTLPTPSDKTAPNTLASEGSSCLTSESNCKCDEELESDLGSVNTSLSLDSKKELEKWKEHDALVDFCTLPEDDAEDEAAQYVDLLVNPERFTGYGGPSAHRVWGSIYNENCFREESSFLDPFGLSKSEDCIEKRTFYRVISGLHSSINIHLSAKYLLTKSKSDSFFKPKGDGEVWGHNVTEFRQHFPNENSERLKNLYFVYLLELKALDKISDFLNGSELYTGDEEEDIDLKSALTDFLRTVRSFPFHFNEKALFSRHDAPQLKAQFHQKFTNITRVMDCVGCQKCKLWGKTQIKGLGAALKILFAHSPNFNDFEGKNFLSRSEIVSLINGIGRLSESIFELGNFRRMIENERKT